jgi:Cft2 family RNA processing exonuclease
LDDHLNAQTEVYKRQKQEEGKRQKVVKKLTKFKEESKEKHNKETVEGVEFTYHLDHDKLISFEKYERRAKIIVLEPESENTYPFLSTKSKK